jgi:hypothetical protein
LHRGQRTFTVETGGCPCTMQPAHKIFPVFSLPSFLFPPSSIYPNTLPRRNGACIRFAAQPCPSQSPSRDTASPTSRKDTRTARRTTLISPPTPGTSQTTGAIPTRTRTSRRTMAWRKFDRPTRTSSSPGERSTRIRRILTRWCRLLLGLFCTVLYHADRCPLYRRDGLVCQGKIAHVAKYQVSPKDRKATLGCCSGCSRGSGAGPCDVKGATIEWRDEGEGAAPITFPARQPVMVSQASAQSNGNFPAATCT